jgi:acyl dehydratase
MSSSKTNNQWSANVTKHRHALALEEGIFTWQDPVKIAKSLQASAEHSRNRKTNPYQSAMSMLTFYINRDGRQLPDSQRQVLEEAKEGLKQLFRKS